MNDMSVSDARQFLRSNSPTLEAAKAEPVACATCAKLDPRVEEVSARLARQAGGKFVCRECGRDYAPPRTAEQERADTIAWLGKVSVWLNGGECCGQKCSDGVCCAPACTWGDEVKLLHSVADAINAGDHVGAAQ